MRLLVALLFCIFAGTSSGETPDLIGGTPAAAANFPQLVYIQQGSSRCSSTVVSPKGAQGVILTAGHCSPQGGTISPVRIGGRFPIVGDFRAVCTQAPGYARSRYQDDFALCLADRPLQVEPATISARRVRRGEIVQLTGWGCTYAPGGTVPPGGPGNDGILRVGTAKVSQAAGADSWFYTETLSGFTAALCSGDSGSSALEIRSAVEVGTDGAPEPARPPRPVVLGVNSRGDRRSISMMSAASEPNAQAFFKAWAREHSARVCGVSEVCR
jgi:hypothetical protein